MLAIIVMPTAGQWLQNFQVGQNAKPSETPFGGWQSDCLIYSQRVYDTFYSLPRIDGQMNKINVNN